MATSGKAVAFSGLAVAVGLSGLLLFEPAALRSFGIGGALIVASSVFYALRSSRPCSACWVRGSIRWGSPACANRRRLGRPLGSQRTPPANPAGSGWPTGSWPRPFAVLHPDPRRSCSSLGPPVLPARPGHPGCPRSCPPGIESREASVALGAPTSEPARRRRSSSSPTVQGRHRPTRPTSRSGSSTTVPRSTTIDGVDRVEEPISRSA